MESEQEKDFKKRLKKRIDEGFERLWKARYGRLEVIINEERKIYDVICSPRIRVK